MMMKTIAILVVLVHYFTGNLAYEIIQNNQDNITEVVEYILLDGPNPCARQCQTNSTPMTCRYHFAAEWYHSLSKACYDCPYVEEDCYRQDCIPADGNKRPLLVINRKMPGPSIEVCLGDEVIIDVENNLVSDSTTIHWHGHHQRDSPYMDGVPYVTQCPIPPGTIFRYQFNVKNAGTHFWHSHSGFQRADGAFGPFIVRAPKELNPHHGLYDYDLSEHTITLLDWGREIGVDKFTNHHHNDGDNKPETLLINGLGRFKVFDDGNSSIHTPTARFLVEKDFRYRFRVINAGFLNCPIEISVDNHTLLAISSDGSDFKAIETESIVTYAGERFDFILKADQPNDVYWMRFSGLMDCDERFKRAHQVAVLQYKNVDNKYPAGEPDYDQSKKSGMQINSLNVGTETNDTKTVSIPELSALDAWDGSLKEKADFQYYISYDFYRIDNPHFHKFPHYGFNNVTDPKKQLLTPQLNHISMKLLSFPLLSQRYQIDEKMICNETTVQGCDKDYCECTHVVNVPLNSIVELVLIDKGFAYDANHPFHLHGHAFRVVSMERIGKNVTVSEVYRRDKNGQIKRNLIDAPIKDTVTVPDGGYTIVRFNASNPGYWLFHCHIEFHVEVGMALVFKIGDDHEMPPIPKNFPTCGNYYPSDNNDRNECTNGWMPGFLQNVLPHIYKDYCINSSASSRNIVVIFYIILPILLSLLRY